MQTRAPVLRPDIFSDTPTITAGMSTRHGGVSGPPYDTLNLGRHVGDDSSCVEENRRRFCAALDADPVWLATAGQVHGSTVRVVDAPRHEPFCDALVTTTPKLLIAIATADCAAILLADPDNEVIGACHAGWRGAVAKIAPKTVAKMEENGASASNVRAFIGPCISCDAFEVGSEVAAQFEDTFVHRYPRSQSGSSSGDNRWDRPHVDLKATLRQQLNDAGLDSDAIEVSDRCTVTETDTFFSHRAADGTTGRMFGAIVLRH